MTEVILRMCATMSAKGLGVVAGVGVAWAVVVVVGLGLGTWAGGVSGGVVFRVVSGVGWEGTTGLGDGGGLGFSRGGRGVSTSRVSMGGGLLLASLRGRGCGVSSVGMGDGGWVLVQGEAGGDSLRREVGKVGRGGAVGFCRSRRIDYVVLRVRGVVAMV